MKTLYKTSLLLFAFFLTTILQPQKTTAQVSVSFQVFYDNLSPYGSWIQSPNYGYVWVPRVTVGFTPYHTNGYWVYTDYGWTWVSNYSWGWAPFHYGRWYYDPYYDWVWVPDNQWGPAWVCWRSSPDYYGWAPMGPGISISVAYSSGYSVPHNHWTFVRNRDFGRSNISRYYISNTQNVTIVRNTTVINNGIRKDKSRNVNYAAGPNRMDVQKRTGKSWSAVKLKDRNSPGQNSNSKELQLYRPQVKKDNASGNRAKPKRITEAKDWKRQNGPAADAVRNNKPQKEVNTPKITRPQREPITPSKERENRPKIDKPQRDVVPQRAEPAPKPQRVNPPNKPRDVVPQRPQSPRIDRPQNPRPIPNRDRGNPNGNRVNLPVGKVI